MTNPMLVEVLRGGAVESFHRGALAILDADGALRCAIGDIDRPVFPRSAVKALQALPLLESGAADRFGVTDEELALACASHNGEPRHVAVAGALLARLGLDAGALECGSHWPLLDRAQRELASRGDQPGPLHNNCSGKHAGFVCLGCLLAEGEALGAGGAGGGGTGARRAWLAGYVRPEHPVMRAVTDALSGVTGLDLDHAPVGTDGCSIPTFGMPLRSLALGFARFGTGRGLSPRRVEAATRLRHAVASHPFMVAGSGRFDTRVMERLGERAFVKVGAEGVYCAALPGQGWGVALKMDDGNNARAAEVVMAAVLEALLPLDEDEAAFLGELSTAVMRNWNGLVVGGLRAGAPLREALGER